MRYLLVIILALLGLTLQAQPDYGSGNYVLSNYQTCTHNGKHPVLGGIPLPGCYVTTDSYGRQAFAKDSTILQDSMLIHALVRMGTTNDILYADTTDLRPIAGGGGGGGTVTTDGTLSGDGSAGSPLSVNEGALTITQSQISDLSHPVSDAVYGVAWDGDGTNAPSKNAVYDKIESLAGGHDAVTLSGAYDYITLSGQDIIRGQIDLTTDVTGVLGDANVSESSVTQHEGALTITESQISDLSHTTDTNFGITDIASTGNRTHTFTGHSLNLTGMSSYNTTTIGNMTWTAGGGDVQMSGTAVSGLTFTTGNSLDMSFSSDGGLTLSTFSGDLDLSVFPGNDLLISEAPTLDNTIDSILVRDNVTGAVKLRSASGIITSPAGSDTEIQFNNSGSFGATPALTYTESGGGSVSSLNIINSNPKISLDTDDGSGSPEIEFLTSGSAYWYLTGQSTFMSWKNSSVTPVLEMSQAGQLTLSGYLAGGFNDASPFRLMGLTSTGIVKSVTALNAVTEASVTQHEAALTITESQISDLAHDKLGTSFTADRILLGDGTPDGTTDANLTWDGNALKVGTSSPTAARMVVAASTPGTTVFSWYNDNFAAQEVYHQIGNISRNYRVGLSASANFFIKDGTGGTTPFTIESATPDDFLYVGTNGVGMGVDDQPTAQLYVLPSTSTKDGIRVLMDNINTIYEDNYAGLTILNTESANGNIANINMGNGTSRAAGSIGTIITDHPNNYGELVFYTNGAGGFDEKVRIDEDGNVGIGTNTPTSKLHVDVGASGGVDIEGDAWARLRINASNYAQYGLSSDNIGFSIYDYTNAAYRMTLNSAGNIGIGAGAGTALYERLTIQSSSSGNSAIQFRNSTTGSAGTDGVFMGLNNAENGYFWNYESNDLVFGTANTSRLVIKSGGNINMGLNSVANAFTNYYDANNYISLYPNNNISNINVGGSTQGLLDINPDASNGTGSATLRLFRSTNTTGAKSFNIMQGDGTATVKVLINPNGDSYFNTSGNMGLNTTAPNAQLSIGNNVGAGFLNNYSEYQILLYDAGVASGSYGIGIVPSTMSFNTNGSFTFQRSGTTNLFHIHTNGNIGMGTESYGGSAVRNLVITNGVAPTTSVTNSIALWAEDVAASSELRVRDEAANVTTLSPHNFSGIPQGPSEEMAWSFYSERDGKYVNVDMLKLARLVEELTGEKLVYIGNVNDNK